SGAAPAIASAHAATVAAEAEPDPDDSWFQGAPRAPGAPGTRYVFADGATMTLESVPATTAPAPEPLRLDVELANGQPEQLQPYLGMPAHAIVLREDGVVFAPLRPLGSISMASQMALTMRTPADSLPGSLSRKLAAMGGMAHGMTPGGASGSFA